ncbi:hypothetical protein [Methylobacterium indicum]|uniref:Uncharacterized protein n=1 Tax=Methylobacterium indicum TaxID=1775910 RepID=A0A8H8X0G0_9HYPH|nr:hypothetical protein [Methylobacterium indicum]BCM87592.1 hypothetical protein mvi_60530 [Methylobacterium indicum]
MSFDESAYLNWLRQPADGREVAAQLRLMLSHVERDREEIISLFNREEVRNDVLVELMKWNERLKPSTKRDRIGRAAVRFWVAQTLSTTVMRSHALDVAYDYGHGLNEIMEIGADGLFEVATSQFLALRSVADDLTNWLKDRSIVRPLIIESPLGNSLPVQVTTDFAKSKNIDLTTYAWNTPRNDRPARGATIDDAAAACTAFANDFDLVIFIDDVSTGTRFLKLHDALIEHLGAERFLPLALVVNDTQRPQNAEHMNRKRLMERLSEQATRIGYEDVWTEIPLQRLFRLDELSFYRWERALIWEDSDLIAGKRKINLFFTILDHVSDILSDLASAQSSFRPHLEHAWAQDVSGQTSDVALGSIQSEFANLASEIQPKDLKSAIEAEARSEFPHDYAGQYVGAGREMDFVKERWDWLRAKYLDLVSMKVGTERAWMSWRAVDNVFAASFHEHTPRPSRDQAATPYTISFNVTIKKLNERLRWRIHQGQ